ncbi:MULTISPECIES: hypothetical protein [Methylobacterium]|jgi:hypothetical protein|uniref:Uncharacterized protein n=1 Tax=Methylobacterium goesingense TaxID=243690 RepID=A0ABV2L7S5_9HYPH|nr:MULTISPECIES: hypothetical protein [Methylobacterium]MBY0257256.1 hypothetical protein [Methylobacterium sp.]MCJ2043723.1 hypothetical protein [Methylobacterium sp. J-078]GJD74192.1 hypothetical protein CFIICLFH_2426 [Methylobacterium goesingense]
MSRFRTLCARLSRQPSLSLILILCGTALLLWVPILVLRHEPVWFW